MNRTCSLKLLFCNRKFSKRKLHCCNSSQYKEWPKNQTHQGKGLVICGASLGLTLAFVPDGCLLTVLGQYSDTMGYHLNGSSSDLPGLERRRLKCDTSYSSCLLAAATACFQILELDPNSDSPFMGIQLLTTTNCPCRGIGFYMLLLLYLLQPEPTQWERGPLSSLTTQPDWCSEHPK